MVTAVQQLSLQDFLELSEDGVTYELVDGQAVPKMSPKKFHARLTRIFLSQLTVWAGESGEAFPELAVTLTRHSETWVPVPDVLYLSRERFPSDWDEDGPCSIAPDLVIEIISPGQPFGQLSRKAEDYIEAGVKRVWVVDSKARSITVFYPDATPRTFVGDTALTDEWLPGLEILPAWIFQQARI